MSGEDLPPEFVVAMPDGALEPSIRQGTALIFSTSAKPAPGLGVLVEDADGQRYVRKHAQGAGRGWRALATHPSYLSLDAEADGLQLLAVMTGRLDGSV